MLITTTQKIEGYKVTQYIGPVFGEVVAGIDFIKDFKAGLSNFFGGRSSTYENELVKAREDALREVSERAALMGANAIIGMAVDYEVLGVNNGMMMVIVSGTAVKFE
ncbi:MAG TPA: heavy metal-binding domain-containing protein [Oscillospiraceae bacterium]|nr:heavy metal-binding domain-containing protein [Oscillospiraceae bacterium]